MNRCDVCGRDTTWKERLCETCDGKRLAEEILAEFRAAITREREEPSDE